METAAAFQAVHRRSFMRSTLVITLLNTAFWFALHFGVAEILTHLPAGTQHRLFDWNRPFFQVS